MKIGKIEIDNGAVLAPMAGFTDIGFRHVCRLSGAALTYTEMVSAKGLVMNSVKTESLLHLSELETPSAVQIFGHEPAVIADCVQHPALEKFDIIDINMGCPVPKIVKNGEGSALLKTPDIAEQIVKSASGSSKAEVTVKIRTGFDSRHVFDAGKFAVRMQDAGAKAVAVHGRTMEQGYSGTADWQVIAAIKKVLQIPLIANGDVKTSEDFKKITEVTGADSVMIGRGALGKPSLFSEAAGAAPVLTQKEAILMHIGILEKYYPEKLIANMMKKHICYYIGHRHGGKAVRQAVVLSQDLAEMKKIVEESFI